MQWDSSARRCWLHNVIHKRACYYHWSVNSDSSILLVVCGFTFIYNLPLPWFAGVPSFPPYGNIGITMVTIDLTLLRDVLVLILMVSEVVVCISVNVTSSSHITPTSSLNCSFKYHCHNPKLCTGIQIFWKDGCYTARVSTDMTSKLNNFGSSHKDLVWWSVCFIIHWSTVMRSCLS